MSARVKRIAIAIGVGVALLIASPIDDFAIAAFIAWRASRLRRRRKG